MADSGALHWLALRLRALRAFSFPLSALPVWVGTAAVLPPSQWDWGALLVATVAVLMLHSAGNLFNDYFDFTAGADRRDEDDEGRPGRLLVRGEMTAPQILHEALFCLCLGFLAAGYLVWRAGPALAGYFGGAVFALYAYTGPPFRLKGRALGEVVMLVVFGPLIVGGAAYAQGVGMSFELLVLSVPVGMVTTSVLAGNNLRDYSEDAASDTRTMAQLIGSRGQRVLYTVLVLGQTFGVAAFGLTGLAGPEAVFAPLLLVLIFGTLRRVWRGERLPDVDARTARFGTALLTLLFLSLCLH